MKGNLTDPLGRFFFSDAGNFEAILFEDLYQMTRNSFVITCIFIAKLTIPLVTKLYRGAKNKYQVSSCNYLGCGLINFHP